MKRGLENATNEELQEMLTQAKKKVRALQEVDRTPGQYLSTPMGRRVPVGHGG